MKTTITLFILVGVLLIVGVAFYFFFINTPKPSPINEEPTVVFPGSTTTVTPVQSIPKPIPADTTTQQQVTQEFQSDLPNSDTLNLTDIVVLDSYSIANWSDENIGGMVLFKKNTENKWDILLIDGGVFELESLIDIGVPELTAKGLLQVY